MWGGSPPHAPPVLRRKWAGQGRGSRGRKLDHRVLALAGLLVGCGLPADRHEILGAGGYGFPRDQVEILADVGVGDLRIRHVRMVTGACAGGYIEHLELDGPIGPDATAHLDRMLSSAARCRMADGSAYAKVVYLNSRGGTLFDGLRIAEVLRFHEVETIVLGGQRCASACAIAFLGGLHRTIVGDGRLLLHAPYVEDAGEIRCAAPDRASELQEHVTAVLGPQAGPRVFARMMRYCSETDGWVLGAAEARRYGITTR